MYRYIKGYMNDIQALLDSGGYNDIEQLKREFLIKLEFFKHERLVHLIVTFMVINAMFVCFAIFSTTLNSGFGIVSLIMLVLRLIDIRQKGLIPAEKGLTVAS